MMKKVLLCLSMVVFSTALSAQNEESTSSDAELKPDNGSLLLEITGNPFSPDDGFIDFGYIRGRYTFTDNLILRLGLRGFTTNEQVTEDLVENIRNFSLRPGAEWHFGGNNRVSPFVGAEIVLDFQHSNARDLNGHFVTGATNRNGANRGFFNLGLSAVTGADIYINSHLYIGIEFGLLYARENLTEITFSDPNNLEPVLTDTIEPRVANYFVPVFINSFRIGFKLF